MIQDVAIRGKLKDAFIEFQHTNIATDKYSNYELVNSMSLIQRTELYNNNKDLLDELFYKTKICGNEGLIYNINLDDLNSMVIDSIASKINFFPKKWLDIKEGNIVLNPNNNIQLVLYGNSQEYTKNLKIGKFMLYEDNEYTKNPLHVYVAKIINKTTDDNKAIYTITFNQNSYDEKTILFVNTSTMPNAFSRQKAINSLIKEYRFEIIEHIRNVNGFDIIIGNLL